MQGLFRSLYTIIGTDEEIRYRVETGSDMLSIVDNNPFRPPPPPPHPPFLRLAVCGSNAAYRQAVSRAQGSIAKCDGC